jgi:UDP-N-acetylmuramyl tripeptide synthase
VIRRRAAVSAAKLTGELSRRLRLGGGTALPGLVAERIDPAIIPEMARELGQGSALVTGTNGKTTTAALLRNILQASGLSTVANRAGSNMMRGIAAALAESASWSGNIRGRRKRIGVFEIDEATLPHAAKALQPRLVLFTNLFRDQLDRYGEVEHVAEVWRQTIAGLGEDVIIVLNADDPSLAMLGKGARCKVVYYGLKDRSPGGGRKLEHAADARWCGNCGAELAYSAVFYGHLGHWRCDACKAERPPVDVGIARIVSAADSSTLTLALAGGEEAEVKLPLSGLYNAYNALAATAASGALGATKHDVERGLRSATATFGRQEKLTVEGREVHVILAKNPAGLNEVLRTITSTGRASNLAFFLNDDIPDGRDVSWIWDVDFELLSPRTTRVTVGGTRAWDMALRLKYAGFDTLEHVEEETTEALKRALADTPEGQPLTVVPTYSAMLEVREVLARWAGQRSFWEGG